MADKIWKLASGGAMSLATNWTDDVAPVASSTYDFYFTSSIGASAQINTIQGQRASSIIFGPIDKTLYPSVQWRTDSTGNVQYFIVSGSEFVWDDRSDGALNYGSQGTTVFNTTLSGSSTTNLRKKGEGDILWRQYGAVTTKPGGVLTIEDGLMSFGNGGDTNNFSYVNIGDPDIAPVGRIGIGGYSPSTNTTPNAQTHVGRFIINQDFQLGAEWWTALGTAISIVLGNTGDPITLNTNRPVHNVTTKKILAGIYGNISGASGLNFRINDGLSLTMNGTNTYTGDTSIEYGTLNISGYALGSSSLVYSSTGGSVGITAGTVLGGLTGDKDLTTGNAYSVGNANKNEEFNGSMQGASAVTKIGTGEWYNNNNTSYSTRTGATTVSNGALYVGYDDTLGQTATGGVTVNNAGAIRFYGAAPPSKAWSIGGTAGYYGGKHVVFEGSATVSSSITLTSDAQFDASAGGLTLTGSGNVTAAGYNLTLVTGTYIINKILALGAGSLVANSSYISLGSANTFSGYYYNDSGQTTITNGSALSSATLAQYGGDVTFDGVSAATIAGVYDASANIIGTGITTLSIGTSALANGMFEGTINGVTTLTKTGTGLLSLRNICSHTSTTIVSDGILELAHIYALDTTTALTVASGKTLQVAPAVAGGNINIPCDTTINGGNFIIA